MADKNYVYYVEGQCEEKLLKTLKTDMRLIQPGKVIKRNVIQDKLRQAQLNTLKKGTTAVLVFDTDTDEGFCQCVSDIYASGVSYFYIDGRPI